MFLDNSLSFGAGWSTPTAAITGTVDGTHIIDITGAGVGTAPTMINGFPATNTAIGADWGAGDGVAIPHLYVAVTTTGTGSGNVTFSVSAAPDNGSYAEGSYTTIFTSKPVTGTEMVAGEYFTAPLPPTLYSLEGEALPRFYKITYTVAGTVGAVKFLSGLVLNPQQSILAGKYNNNFLVV